MVKTIEFCARKPELGRPILLNLLQKGSVTDNDVAVLRREAFVDRTLTRIEIEDLFALDAVARPQSDAWAEFFIEAVTDFVVWDQRPTGVLDEAQARWLIAKADAAQTTSCFAVLINILDHAHRVPRWYPAAVRSRAVAGWPSLTMCPTSPGGEPIPCIA